MRRIAGRFTASSRRIVRRAWRRSSRSVPRNFAGTEWHLNEREKVKGPGSNSSTDIEITPREVHEMQSRGAAFLFVDVREKWEHETSRIEGAVLIPLREIPASLPKLAGAGDVVLFC